jgi:hypothetical protein
MKHLKLYEEFGFDKPVSNEYYQQVDPYDVEEIKKKLGIVFDMGLLDDDDELEEEDDSISGDKYTQEEENKIMAYFSKPEFSYDVRGCEMFIYKRKKLVKRPGDHHYIVVDITKLSDEWYYIVFITEPPEFKEESGNITAYKCDQLEGLLELLKDKFK